MKDRKLHVIETAYKLFIEKGYLATSIQDILDGSGISKGTFYNYFPSKSALFMEIFRSYYKRIQKQREELLIGQDLADPEIFIRQLEIHVHLNRQSKLLLLIEQVQGSNDEELKMFMDKVQLLTIRWLYSRFLNLFGEAYKPYLLDHAILFYGMLVMTHHFINRANLAGSSDIQVIRFCMDRITILVHHALEKGEQILDPELMDTWLPNFRGNHLNQCHNDLLQTALSLKKALNKVLPDRESRQRASELIDFIQEELVESKEPRNHLVSSMLEVLKARYSHLADSEMQGFNETIHECLRQLERDI